MLEKNISGGFTKEIYDALLIDKILTIRIIDYLLTKYIPVNLHQETKEYLKVISEINCVNYVWRNKTVALIGTQKFAISRWWLSKGIEVIQTKPDIFSTKNLREAMKCFIAGSAVIKAINNWMLASQIIDKGKSGLTNFGLSIYKNDPKLLKSATWWGIHLSLCFSDRGEPYIQFFLKLDSLSKDWIAWKQLSERLYSAIEDAAEQSIDSNLEGVKKMFLGDNPLAELGLIEIRKERQGSGMFVRLGSPRLTDEILIHALAMCRFAHFRSRDSVDFSTLANTGLPNFLCCSKDQLRQHYQRMSQMHEWQTYFSFDRAVDLESITFKDACNPEQTVLLLLQKGEDTWM